jgi:hypothetical protein
MPDLDTTAGSSSAAGDSAISAGADAMAADLDSLDSADTAEVEAGTDDTASEGESSEPEVEAAAEAPVEEAETEEQPAEEEAPVEPAKDENAEELPEGVVIREKANGKKEWVFPENRARSIYSAYKSAQAAEDVFGEPLTAELAQSRQNAFIDQESMIADYLSGEPQAEGRFLNQLANWARAAQENGDVQHNPLHSIAGKLPQFLAEAGGSEAFEALAAPVFRMQLDALYQEALGEDQKDLFASIQHLDKRLFNTFRKRADIAVPDPLARREAELSAREAKLKQVDTDRARAEYGTWQAKTKEQIKNTVSEALSERLGPNVIKSYERFPTELQAVKNLLQAEFQAALKKDVAWQTYIDQAGRRAANAKSPDIRDAITADLQARYKAKAIHWADPARNAKVKEILSQRAAAIKANSEANHQRLQKGAERRDPGAIGTPVKRTVAQTPNGRSTAEDWASAIDAL